MKADNKVVSVSLSGVPCVVITERDRGLNTPVLYIPVRTDYGETDVAALKRAIKIAEWLTDDIAVKKSSSTNHNRGDLSHGNSSEG